MKIMGRRGFTLIELMIVVAIIGLLAAIAIPKMGSFIQKANESSTLKKLGSVRSALSVYYADNEGFYPSDLAFMNAPGNRYMEGMFPVYTLQHGRAESVTYVAASSGTLDTGDFAYVNTGPAIGIIWVACTHTDAVGRVWSTF